MAAKAIEDEEKEGQEASSVGKGSGERKILLVIVVELSPGKQNAYWRRKCSKSLGLSKTNQSKLTSSKKNFFSNFV